MRFGKSARTGAKEEIASFDCSIAAREKVQTFERMYADYEAEVRKAEGWIDAASRDLEDARRMVEQKTREIEKTEPVADTREELAARKSSLRALRALVATREKLSLKIDYEKQRLEEKEEEKKQYAAGGHRRERLQNSPLLPQCSLAP